MAVVYETTNNVANNTLNFDIFEALDEMFNSKNALFLEGAISIEDFFADTLSASREEVAVKPQIWLIPNLQISGKVINWYAEIYFTEEYCARAGIGARNGWHEPPIYKTRVCKTSAYSCYIDDSQLSNFLAAHRDYEVFYITD